MIIQWMPILNIPCSTYIVLYCTYIIFTLILLVNIKFYFTWYAKREKLYLKTVIANRSMEIINITVYFCTKSSILSTELSLSMLYFLSSVYMSLIGIHFDNIN